MSSRLNEPNFYIIGAPKCGTTSLSAWLSLHRNIFMCDPKEPYFFSQDIRSIRSADTLDDYRKLFQETTDNHFAVGEASTTYLRSQVAVPAILKRCPNAKFIVCLRNPIKMVASVHMQLYQGAIEPERSFEKAWSLQSARQSGQHLPNVCLDPRNLQYGKACTLGNQVEKLLSHTPRQQILFVFLEDLRRDPRCVYRHVLGFLDVPDDGRCTFPVKNKRSEPKILLLRQLSVQLNHFKQNLGIKQSLGIGTLIRKINTQSVAAEVKNDSDLLENELKVYFSADIKKLSNLVGRDLSAWLQ